MNRIINYFAVVCGQFDRGIEQESLSFTQFMRLSFSFNTIVGRSNWWAVRDLRIAFNLFQKVMRNIVKSATLIFLWWNVQKLHVRNTITRNGEIKWKSYRCYSFSLSSSVREDTPTTILGTPFLFFPTFAYFFLFSVIGVLVNTYIWWFVRCGENTILRSFVFNLNETKM